MGIERLYPLVQNGRELLIALVARNATRRPVVVGLALTRLPLARPELCLLSVDTTVADLPQEDRCVVHRAIRQTVHQAHAIPVLVMPVYPARDRTAVFGEVPSTNARQLGRFEAGMGRLKALCAH